MATNLSDSFHTPYRPERLRADVLNRGEATFKSDLQEIVEVLQAVHMLLAFRLFVVFVAVDVEDEVHSKRGVGGRGGQRIRFSHDGYPFLG